MFYGGFGAILTPLFGVSSAFAGDEVGYNNALGFFCIRTLAVAAVYAFFQASESDT